MFGLHPNAEIGYLTQLGETLFETILSVSGGSGAAKGGENSVKSIIGAFLKELPANFNMLEIQSKFADDLTPYFIVAMQECEKMNALLNEIRFSLTELD